MPPNISSSGASASHTWARASGATRSASGRGGGASPVRGPRATSVPSASAVMTAIMTKVAGQPKWLPMKVPSGTPNTVDPEEPSATAARALPRFSGRADAAAST